MNIYILGNGQPVIDIIIALKDSTINILGFEQDNPLIEFMQNEFLDTLSKFNIKHNNFNEVKQKIDLIFVVNYNKIINVSKFDDKLIINLHIGLLPKYRGNSANAWAVINGEKKVGYTIHKVINLLDAGDIYYKFEYDITDDNNYLPAKCAINKDIINNIEKILLKIYNKYLSPVSQNGLPFMYCTKLRPSMGLIDNWNVSTDLLLRKMYVFGLPLGTGLKFNNKGVEYCIEKISRIKNFAPSIGVPGGILLINNNSMWVKTSDTAVSIDRILVEGKEINPNERFKIGNIL